MSKRCKQNNILRASKINKVNLHQPLHSLSTNVQESTVTFVPDFSYAEDQISVPSINLLVEIPNSHDDTLIGHLARVYNTSFLKMAWDSSYTTFLEDSVFSKSDFDTMFQTTILPSVESPETSLVSQSSHYLPSTTTVGRECKPDENGDVLQPRDPEQAPNEGRRFFIISDRDFVADMAALTQRDVGRCRIGYALFPSSMLTNGYEIDEQSTYDGKVILEEINNWINDVQSMDELHAPMGLPSEHMPGPWLAPHECWGIVHEPEEMVFIMGSFQHLTGSDRVGIATFPLCPGVEDPRDEAGYSTDATITDPELE